MLYSIMHCYYCEPAMQGKEKNKGNDTELGGLPMVGVMSQTTNPSARKTNISTTGW